MHTARVVIQLCKDTRDQSLPADFFSIEKFMMHPSHVREGQNKQVLETSCSPLGWYYHSESLFLNYGPSPFLHHVLFPEETWRNIEIISDLKITKYLYLLAHSRTESNDLLHFPLKVQPWDMGCLCEQAFHSLHRHLLSKHQAVIAPWRQGTYPFGVVLSHVI